MKTAMDLNHIAPIQIWWESAALSRVAATGEDEDEDDDEHENEWCQAMTNSAKSKLIVPNKDEHNLNILLEFAPIIRLIEGFPMTN